MSCVVIWEKGLLDSGNSLCKGPGARRASMPEERRGRQCG